MIHHTQCGGEDFVWTALASVGDGVITTDAEGKIAFINGVAESLTGWSPTEAAGQSLDAVFRIVNEHTRAAVENPAVRALREGGIAGLANHTILLSRYGAEIPIDDSAAPIRDEQGQIVGCVLVFRDITRRRKAERALERSEGELADFFENANVPLHRVGPDGIILRANQAELELLGYAEEEYVGHHIAEFHADRPIIDDILSRLLRGESVNKQPSRLRCKDGSIREVLVNSTGLWENGKFIHSRCVTLDVTDSKRAEQTRTLLAAIVSASDDAIVSKTLEGKILSWNAGAERIFGYRADEAVGQTIELIIPPELRDEERMILERLRQGQRIDHYETVRVAKDGRRIDVSLTISPLWDEQGNIVGASKVARDVTERKRSEQALREGDRRKDEFIAILAHELRNPLAALCIGLEVMKTLEADPTRLREIRGMMERQSRQLVAMIDDLLESSRITHGKLELRNSRVSLAEIVENSIETARPVIDQGRHQLSVEISDEKLEAEGDPHRLVQVLSNLLNNAAKYTPEGGRITLKLQRHGEQALLAVKDSGIGIPAPMQGKIFEMFGQLGPTLDRGAPGLGMGLTLSKRLTEMHGGTIEVHSEGQGKGSEFRVHLPLAGEAEEGTATAEEPYAGDPASTIRRRVLIVDDNADLAQMLCILIENLGNHVRTAADGAQAIAIAPDFLPDIVFMDLGMPRMNGYDAAAHIRRQSWGKDMVLVALTGWGQEEDRQRIRQAGFNCHLVKPANVDRLRQLLADLK